MKLKVNIKFIDKYTGELHEVGDVIDVDKARSEELLADKRRLVAVVSETPKKRTTKK